MKSKRFNKKLSLNKLTVSNLSGINGGDVGTRTTSFDTWNSLCLQTCNEYSCAFDTRCPDVGCI